MQHPTSSVVTIPATILTASVSAPGPVPLTHTGVYVSAAGAIRPTVSMAEQQQVHNSYYLNKTSHKIF